MGYSKEEAKRVLKELELQSRHARNNNKVTLEEAVQTAYKGYIQSKYLYILTQIDTLRRFHIRRKNKRYLRKWKRKEKEIINKLHTLERE